MVQRLSVRLQGTWMRNGRVAIVCTFERLSLDSRGASFFSWKTRRSTVVASNATDFRVTHSDSTVSKAKRMMTEHRLKANIACLSIVQE